MSEEYHNTFRDEERSFRWTNEVRSGRADAPTALLTLLACKDVCIQGHGPCMA